MYLPREGSGPLNFGGAGRMGMTRERGGKISAVMFFVTATALPWLNGAHPCFGEVVSGLETVFNISQVKTYRNGRPIEPVVIERVRIWPVGDPEPLPEAQPYAPQIRALTPADDIKK